tara:strand:- start:2114 stop:2497 length:384 start_codon:yes stop_codon:yes gene_type:complete
MPIKYKVIDRRNPQDPEAPNKFYASSSIDGKSDIEQLTKRIEKISTVSGADIRAVLYAMVDVVPSLLSEGRNVQLGDLGYFRVSISSNPSDTAEEVSASNIRTSRIIFTPGKKFKDMLKSLTFEKTS